MDDFQIESDAAIASRLQRLLDGEDVEDDFWTGAGAEEEFCMTGSNGNLNPEVESMAMVQALQDLDSRTPGGDEGFAAALDSRFTGEGMSDEVLAIALQASLAEEAYIETRTEEDTAAFVASTTGRAWNFVAKVLELHERLAQQVVNTALEGFLEPVAKDDIVFLTERLLATQVAFWNAGKPYKTDIGYHYTSEANMSRIKTDGLLSKAEREQLNIQAAYHGSSFGDGVYTGNNPTDFLGRYGSVGLLVLRLRGQCGVYGSSIDATAVNTFLNLPQPIASIVVLRESSQCVAVLRFDGSKLVTPPAKAFLAEAHAAIQQLVDDLINQEPSIVIPQDVYLDSKPSATDSGKKGTRPAKLGSISYKMPIGITPEHYTIVKPCQLEDCPICFVPYYQQGPGVVVRLENCRHELHLACLKQAAAHKAQCPLCRQSFQGGTPRGKMPTGTMTVTRKPAVTCSGFPSGSFEIQYSFPAGFQLSYHPNPGHLYSSVTRTAYLPDTKAGRRLLSRLQEAFRHGLCFTIGTSLFSGKSNVLTWASIPHKTKVSGGFISHGFPDPAYIVNCHAAMDALQIEPAFSDSIQEDGQSH